MMFRKRSCWSEVTQVAEPEETVLEWVYQDLGAANAGDVAQGHREAVEQSVYYTGRLLLPQSANCFLQVCTQRYRVSAILQGHSRGRSLQFCVPW